MSKLTVPKNRKAKSDHFQQKRGGNSFVYSISCGNCRKELLLYQKDGFKYQHTKRLYIDRIITAQNDYDIVKSKAKCLYCNFMLGTPIRYTKHNEDRIAVTVTAHSIHKKKLL